MEVLGKGRIAHVLGQPLKMLTVTPPVVVFWIPVFKLRKETGSKPLVNDVVGEFPNENWSLT